MLIQCALLGSVRDRGEPMKYPYGYLMFRLCIIQ
jgi:hypothetical protein